MSTFHINRKKKWAGEGSLATPITHTPETPDEWSSVGSGVCPSTKLCMYLTGTRGGPKLLAWVFESLWFKSCERYGGSARLRDLSPSHGHYWGSQVTFEHFLYVYIIHPYMSSLGLNTLPKKRLLLILSLFGHPLGIHAYVAPRGDHWEGQWGLQQWFFST